MNTLGKITTGLLAAVLVGAAVVVVLSLPDIRRYREIRAM
jgi:energy-converting hydrogenase Eha subunit A